jgi:peroxiredoxin Q/BCP
MGFLEVGMKAPSFTLLNQNGEEISLKDFKEKIVILYFYPKAMTPGCTTQAQCLTKANGSLKKMNAVVLGVSPDLPARLKKFEEKEKINFTLLSDPDFELAKAYGAFGEKKLYGKTYMGLIRSTFILDEKLKIIKVFPKVNTKTHHDDVIKFLKE